MSDTTGPNAFHDDNDHDDEDDGEALSKLCDNPAYLVLGADDDLVDNIPDFAEIVLDEIELLAKQAELIGLEPSHYVTSPDRRSNRELRDFYHDLGLTVDTAHIDRGPGSSIDGVIYVRRSEIPSIERRAARELRKAKRAVIRDGRRLLRPGKVKASQIDQELERLADVAQLGQDEFRKKLSNLEELEEVNSHLSEHLQERKESEASWKSRAETAECRLHGENERAISWVRKAQELSELYSEWTLVIESEFGIRIQGPVLKLADGTTYAVQSIFGSSLKEHSEALFELINKREPNVRWVHVQCRIRRGIFNAGYLRFDEAATWYEHRFAWSQPWWVILSNRLTAYPGVLSENGINVHECLGNDPVKLARWEEILRKYWGKGIDLRRSPFRS